MASRDQLYLTLLSFLNYHGYTMVVQETKRIKYKFLPNNEIQNLRVNEYCIFTDSELSKEVEKDEECLVFLFDYIRCLCVN